MTRLISYLKGDTSAWHGIALPRCPHCSGPVDIAQLDVALYGVAFDEWKDERGGNVMPRWDVRREWVRLQCAACGTWVEVRNPRGRPASWRWLALGAVVALLVTVPWILSLAAPAG